MRYLNSKQLKEIRNSKNLSASEKRKYIQQSGHHIRKASELCDRIKNINRGNLNRSRLLSVSEL